MLLMHIDEWFGFKLKPLTKLNPVKSQIHYVIVIFSSTKSMEEQEQKECMMTASAVTTNDK
jgi:hypothetical protein